MISSILIIPSISYADTGQASCKWYNFACLLKTYVINPIACGIFHSGCPVSGTTTPIGSTTTCDATECSVTCRAGCPITSCNKDTDCQTGMYCSQTTGTCQPLDGVSPTSTPSLSESCVATPTYGENCFTDRFGKTACNKVLLDCFECYVSPRIDRISIQPVQNNKYYAGFPVFGKVEFSNLGNDLEKVNVKIEIFVDGKIYQTYVVNNFVLSPSTGNNLYFTFTLGKEYLPQTSCSYPTDDVNGRCHDVNVKASIIGSLMGSYSNNMLNTIITSSCPNWNSRIERPSAGAQTSTGNVVFSKLPPELSQNVQFNLLKKIMGGV